MGSSRDKSNKLFYAEISWSYIIDQSPRLNVSSQLLPLACYSWLSLVLCQFSWIDRLDVCFSCEISGALPPIHHKWSGKWQLACLIAAGEIRTELELGANQVRRLHRHAAGARPDVYAGAWPAAGRDRDARGDAKHQNGSVELWLARSRG